MRMHSWLVRGAVVHGCGTALHHGRPHRLTVTRRHQARAAAAAHRQARVGAPRSLLEWQSTQQGALPAGRPAAATRRVASQLARSGFPRVAPAEQEAAHVRHDQWGARRVRWRRRRGGGRAARWVHLHRRRRRGGGGAARPERVAEVEAGARPAARTQSRSFLRRVHRSTRAVLGGITCFMAATSALRLAPLFPLPHHQFITVRPHTTVGRRRRLARRLRPRPA
jgi:hypothetical protein